jgi:hypothetical protein
MGQPQPPQKQSTKARVHEVFKKRLDELAEKSQLAEEGLRGGQREWYVPSDLGAEDLFDIAKLHDTSFDRGEVNANYSQCFQSATDMGTVGDVISLKTQIDYNAAEERQFRFRHASVCRNLAHAMARRRAQGNGPTFAYVEKQAGDAIKAGSGS